MMKANWASHQRKWWGKWHLWLGLTAGVIVSVVGLTGSLLVFRTEIDGALNPELYRCEKTGKHLDFGEVYLVLKEKYPDMPVGYLTLMEGDEANYKLLDIRTREETYINPYTGEIISHRAPAGSFTGLVLEIHRSLLIPVAGRYVVGAASLAMFILTVTGLRAWLPRRWKSLKASLTVRFNAGIRRQTLDWHRVTGFFASPVLTMLSLSGCCFTLNMVILPLMFVFDGQSPAKLMQIFGAQSDTTVHVAPLPVGEVFDLYREAFPSAGIQTVLFPATPAGVYMVNAVQGARPAEGKRTMCCIDRYTGKILFDSEKDLPNVAHAYLTWLQAFHFGSFGGIPTKCIACLAGLLPLFLTVTGFRIWKSRYGKQKRPVENLPANDTDRKRTVMPVNAWHYLWIHLKRGFGYGFRCLLASLLIGTLAGIWGSAILEAIAFIIVFTCLLSVMNLLAALIALVFHLLCVPFGRGSRAILRYFAWSLTFSAVFGIGYAAITQTGLQIF
jgi:uncharacterized iron-regulated membrane protein